MKRHIPRTAWKETRESGRMVVMAPDNYRPDLVSPVPSARSPSPGIAYPQGYRTPRYIDNSEVASLVTKSNGYSDDFDPTTAPSKITQSYSADFDPDSTSNTLNTPQYTEDFESVTQKSASRALIMRHSAHFSGELETIRTSIAETVPEETEAPSIDTYDDETHHETTSGRTSRLTWQYSEDFENTEREETVSYGDSQRSSEETESPSVSTTRRRRSSLEDDSTDDQSSWEQSSEYSEGASEAAYLAECSFLTKAVKRLQCPAIIKDEDVDAKSPQMHPLLAKQSKQPKPDKDELKALKTFCGTVIDRARTRKESDVTIPPRCSTGNPSVKYQLMGLTPGDYVENYGVSPLAINRLRLENTKAKLDKMAKEQVHDPYTCPDCLSVLEELALSEFVKEKLHTAQEQMIREKIDHVANSHFTAQLVQDPTMLPGHLQRNVGHLPSSDIWNRLGQQRAEKDDSIPYDKEEEFISVNPEQTIRRLRSRICPHINKNDIKGVTTNGNDHMDDEILNYIQKTQAQVEDVQKELLMESDRLKELDPEQFWKLYFEKLKGFNGLPNLQQSKLFS